LVIRIVNVRYPFTLRHFYTTMLSELES
jgi:hypothetical protein